MLDSILVMRIDDFLPRVSTARKKKRQLTTEAWGTPKFRNWREMKDPTKETKNNLPKNAGGKSEKVFSESHGKKVFQKRGRDPKCYMVMLGLIGRG